MDPNCIFCKIISGQIKAQTVYEDDHVIAFLDTSPIFPGHTLVSPKQHYLTLMDVPPHMLQPLFTTAQTVCRAVEKGLDAHGSFVAINNKISQSVPHLHVHVIPRRAKDGMKGFFWPRRPYKDPEEMAATATAIRGAIER